MTTRHFYADREETLEITNANDSLATMYFSVEEIESFIKMGYPEELSTKVTYMEKQLPNNLANMNDIGNKSFKEIACWIRENVELYD